MSDVVIKAEGLGKKYLIGHQLKKQNPLFWFLPHSSYHCSTLTNSRSFTAIAVYYPKSPCDLSTAKP